MMKCVTVVALAALGLAASARRTSRCPLLTPSRGARCTARRTPPARALPCCPFDTTAPISLLFDGSEDGYANHVFANARMDMAMSIGAATTVGGVTTAPLFGSFTIYDGIIDPAFEIFSGVAAAGTFVRISNTTLFSSATPNFVYTAGPALIAITGPIAFVDPSEGVFTLTSVVAEGGGSFINPDGSFNTFDANASFTGNTQAVPTPGSIAILGLSCLCLAGRRRGNRERVLAANPC